MHRIDMSLNVRHTMHMLQLAPSGEQCKLLYIAFVRLPAINITSKAPVGLVWPLRTSNCESAVQTLINLSNKCWSLIFGHSITPNLHIKIG